MVLINNTKKSIKCQSINAIFRREFEDLRRFAFMQRNVKNVDVLLLFNVLINVKICISIKRGGEASSMKSQQPNACQGAKA